VRHRLVLEHLETFRAQAASVRDGGRPADLSEEVRKRLGWSRMVSGWNSGKISAWST